MDITKYLKNKDIQIKQEDFDIEGMKRDLREGYIEKEKVPDISNMISKDDYNKLQTSYTDLETNYNNTVKQLNDTNNKNSQLNLQNKMISRGFKENDFEEVAKLRNSLYSEEKDDTKAVNMIAERFKSTYFPVTEVKSNGTNPNKEPNDTALKNNGSTGNENDIKITRNTSVANLWIKK